MIPKFAIRNSQFAIFAAGFFSCFLLVFIPYNVYNFLAQLPNPKILTDSNYPVTTKIYDRNGTLLYQIYADQNRTPIKTDTLPKYVLDATIAIEDKNFYYHPGFDLLAILRAFRANMVGETVQGGSTITQQLVKSALLTPERTYERKIKELILAFWAEKIYSKDQLLEFYLNQIPYGGAAYGIEAAAQTYFGKSAASLTLAQAAMLAGLPSAPSIYSPFGSHPELAKQRQEEVLGAMLDQGYLNWEQYNNAKKEPLTFAPLASEIKAPHFVMYVKDLLVAKYGLRTVEQGGLNVVTTLDLPTYDLVAAAIKNGVDQQKYLNVGNGAALVTSPGTGEILAMVGSRDYFDTARDGNVNVTLANRSPGSSIKVVNYAAAFDRKIISPATVIDDAPITYLSAGSPPYSPLNYDNRWHGKVTVRTALASSYNVPAVKILAKLGVDNMLAMGKAMGITTWDDTSRFGLALTLGGGEVTMLDMATVFGVLANSGQRVNLNPIISVKDYKGSTLNDQLRTTNSQVLSPQTTFILSDILSDNAARTPAFGPVSPLIIPNHTVAVKTGTAQDKRDNWTIGYTPSILVAVWVGNNDNSPMSPYLESGNTGAAAIWHPIMAELLKDKPDEKFTRPGDLLSLSVCAANGLLPCDNCPVVRSEYFLPGTEPKQACKIDKPEEKK